LAGSVTVATKSYNNKTVVYTKREMLPVNLIMTSAPKSCDKRQSLPIFMVPSIKDEILKFNNVTKQNKTK